MKAFSALWYNTDIKISGNTVKISHFQNTQPYAYQSHTDARSRNEKTAAEIEQQQFERFKKSQKRSREAIFDLVACNAGQHRDYAGRKQSLKFMTLTFKECITNLTEANQEFTKFIKRLSYAAYRTNKNVIKYLAVPEMQKRGAWHFHVILFNMRYLPHEQIHAAWPFGSICINKLKGLGPSAAAKYITKYISKNITCADYGRYKEQNLLGKKRYSCSRGLLRPWKRRINTTTEQIKKLTQYIFQKRKKNTRPYSLVYQNEYRGRAFLLSVELPRNALPALRKLVSDIFNDTLSRYKKQYNINWEKIINIQEQNYIYDILFDMKTGRLQEIA